MVNTILVNEDKTMEKTIFRTIFRKETLADEIQFLIDPKMIGDNDIQDYRIILQMLLPHFNTNTYKFEYIGKMKQMSVNEELYMDEYYRTVLPLTSEFTSEVGQIKLWFSFYNMKDSDNIELTKTYPCVIDILQADEGASQMGEGTFDLLEELQNQVEELKKQKIDSDFTLNKNDNTIQFYADGVPIGNPIEFDDEVTWTDWE